MHNVTMKPSHSTCMQAVDFLHALECSIIIINLAFLLQKYFKGSILAVIVAPIMVLFLTPLPFI